MRFLYLLLVAVLVSATACSHATTPGVSIRSSLKVLIPAQTTVLAEVQLRKITQTQLYKKHQQELSFPLLDGSSERIGLDPRKDISEVVVAMVGSQFLALVDGHLNPEKVKPNLLSFGGQESKYKGQTLLGTPQNAVLFVNSDTAAVGGLPMLRSLVDRGTGRAEIPVELSEKMSRLPEADQLWVVSRDGLPFLNLPMRSDVKSALSNVVDSITGADAGVEIDSGLHLRADFNCISDAGAQRVNDALRAGIGLGRLTTRDNESELLKAYDAIHVQKSGTKVQVVADLSSEMVEGLLPVLLNLNRH